MAIPDEEGVIEMPDVKSSVLTAAPMDVPFDLILIAELGETKFVNPDPSPKNFVAVIIPVE